jgi:hypothetical protein
LTRYKISNEQDTLGVKKKRTEITIEVEEVIHAIGHRHQLTCAWCPACQCEVPMVTPQSIAISLGVPEREIFRLIEAGKVHFTETDRIFACLSCYRHSTRLKEPANQDIGLPRIEDSLKEAS